MSKKLKIDNSHYELLAIEFIRGLREFYGENIVKFFVQGGCKIFSDMLVNHFNGTQYHTNSHYVTKVGNRYFDATGEVKVNTEEISEPTEDVKKQMASYQNIVDIIFIELMKN